MRVKTESKRAELVQAAVDEFLEQGYDRTQMSNVSSRAKCSKGTLYSYFASKEELYHAAIADLTTHESRAVVTALAQLDGPIDERLKKFGVAFLNALYSPRFQALRRLVFAPSSDSRLGPIVYEDTVRPYVLQTAGLLSAAMKAGELRACEPEIAAHHLCGLLESELLLKFLLRALEDVSPATLQLIAHRAVDSFLAAYRP